MKWLESFTLVMKSSIRTLREKVEDPDRMLQQLIFDMEEELERVRSCVAEAIADEIQLAQRVEGVEKDVDRWLVRAKKAVTRDDEEAAKTALDQKMRAEERLSSLRKELAVQKEHTAELHTSVRDLEDKIRQARQKRTLLVARLTRADACTRIHRAIDSTTSKSAFAQFGRLENRVDRAEARIDAWKRLDSDDVEGEELDAKFAEEERRELLEREFDELKKRAAEVENGSAAS